MTFADPGAAARQIRAPFKSLAVAITASPTSRALLHEARRLRDLFSAPLVIIHSGRASGVEERMMRSVVRDAGLDPDSLLTVPRSRGVVEGILAASQERNVDLIIAGALEKETLVNVYLGSVARRLLRRAYCSVLLFTHPSITPNGFHNIHALVEYTTHGEETVHVAHTMALLERAQVLHLVRDYFIPGFSMVNADFGGGEEGRSQRMKWQAEEEEMMRLFVRGLHLSGMQLELACLYGREGLETRRFVRDHGGDLLVATGPERKSNLLDRLFPHHLEYVFERLPSNLLLVRNMR